MGYGKKSYFMCDLFMNVHIYDAFCGAHIMENY